MDEAGRGSGAPDARWKRGVDASRGQARGPAGRSGGRLGVEILNAADPKTIAVLKQRLTARRFDDLFVVGKSSESGSSGRVSQIR